MTRILICLYCHASFSALPAIEGRIARRQTCNMRETRRIKVPRSNRIAALADSHQLLYVVNLMQRYNPLYSIVKTIINEKILGGFLHGFFENYASDENLGNNHWFWDESKSGGIFIEHGVHFFDMFTGWLGEGKVISAFQLQRPSVKQKINDRVQATVLYQMVS
jgi:predicted dehydrogenase